jgi:hypothetical protein
MTDLSIVFPEINDPDWIRQREENWQIMLDNSDIKSEYRKKDLEKIKRYFFNGEIEPDMPLQDAYIWLFEIFPIQRREGYDYLFLNNDYSQEQVKDITLSALMDLSSSGLTDEQQLTHWDYHLGKQYTAQVIRTCKSGDIVVDIDPYHASRDMLFSIDRYLHRRTYSGSFKVASQRLDYLFEALVAAREQYKLLEEDLFFYLDPFTDILNIDLKSVDNNSDDFLHSFAKEFITCMDQTSDLPEVITNSWSKAKQEI